MQPMGQNNGKTLQNSLNLIEKKFHNSCRTDLFLDNLVLLNSEMLRVHHAIVPLQWKTIPLRKKGALHEV